MKIYLGLATVGLLRAARASYQGVSTLACSRIGMPIGVVSVLMGDATMSTFG